MSWININVNRKTEEYKQLNTYLYNMFAPCGFGIEFRELEDSDMKLLSFRTHDVNDPNANSIGEINLYVINLKCMKPTKKSLCQTPVSSELRELINKVLYPEPPVLEMMVQNIYDLDRQEKLDKWKTSMGLEDYIN